MDDLRTSMDDITAKLKNNNIRLSHQRLKVLDYLNHNRIHPTVEQIYHDLHEDIPTLSKTTIYNTLNTLAEAGLVKVITIEGHEARYDINTDVHGHFKCRACGNIYDFEVNMDLLETVGLNGFQIDNRDIYFTGTCAKCRDQSIGTNN